MRQLLCLTVFLFFPLARCYAAPPLELIKLPPGFKIELYAEGLNAARSMTQGDKGTLFVGTRANGNVYAVVDKDNDNKADRVVTLFKGLRSPNGVAFRDGALYFAEISQLWRLDNAEEKLDDPGKPTLITKNLPSDGWHGWRVIHFGPDDRLYMAMGSPCNVCEKEEPYFSTIISMTPDGKDFQRYARGIRNSVGFDWDSTTKELWFTDNGRDGLGDNLPPDELNHAPKPGMHFGFPYCHGRTINDPEFGEKFPCRNFTPAAQELGAHVASLGMKFYTGTMFPEGYRNQIFIAEHGSWDRSTKSGYRITLVRLQDNKPISYEVFAEGWKQGEDVWGRPVDLFVLPDGSLLVSDDMTGMIYRITYEKLE